MEWLDLHAGSVQAFATLVLVVITAYYAWASRAMVREARANLQSTARLTLQDRLNRVSELFLEHPDLYASLCDPAATGKEHDQRFHIANLLVAVFEEAYVQHHLEHSMSREDWRAWRTTISGLMRLPYLMGYWEQVRHAYGASFANFVENELLSPNACD
ncbi:MAG: hypothetical protein JOZ39_09540 [Chloroflexi bacterium]|nr:hypothetical protein [Chloroflexota bacterium]